MKGSWLAKPPNLLHTQADHCFCIKRRGISWHGCLSKLAQAKPWGEIGSSPFWEWGSAPRPVPTRGLCRQGTDSTGDSPVPFQKGEALVSALGPPPWLPGAGLTPVTGTPKICPPWGHRALLSLWAKPPRVPAPVLTPGCRNQHVSYSLCGY